MSWQIFHIHIPLITLPEPHYGIRAGYGGNFPEHSSTGEEGCHRQPPPSSRDQSASRRLVAAVRLSFVMEIGCMIHFSTRFLQYSMYVSGYDITVCMEARVVCAPRARQHDVCPPTEQIFPSTLQRVQYKFVRNPSC